MLDSASLPDCVSAQPAKPPLTLDGQEISAPAGRVTITIVRVTADRYRVVTTDLRGHRVDCWSTEFTPERIPVDMTVEQAAREFARGAYRTHLADLETPTAVARRVRAA